MSSRAFRFSGEGRESTVRKIYPYQRRKAGSEKNLNTVSSITEEREKKEKTEKRERRLK